MLTVDSPPLLDAVAFAATFPSPLSATGERELLERLGATVAQEGR